MICSVCGLLINGRYFVHEGSQIHDKCYLQHVAPRCAICGGGLSGAILTDTWGNRFHAAHLRQFPPCDSCGRSTAVQIGQGGFRLGDGRVSCALCHGTAVRSGPEAQRHYERVLAQMASWGVVLPTPIPMALQGRRDLIAKLHKAGKPAYKGTYGFTHMESRYELDSNRWLPRPQLTDQNACIYVLHSLPAELFDGALAHEIGHAWAFLSGFPRHQPQLAEGSCNYFRWRLHDEHGTPEAQAHMKAMLEDPDPAYGQGFRRVKQYVDRNGFAALLELLRKSSDFPLFSFY